MPKLVKIAQILEEIETKFISKPDYKTAYGAYSFKIKNRNKVKKANKAEDETDEKKLMQQKKNEYQRRKINKNILIVTKNYKQY